MYPREFFLTHLMLPELLVHFPHEQQGTKFLHFPIFTCLPTFIFLKLAQLKLMFEETSLENINFDLLRMWLPPDYQIKRPGGKDRYVVRAEGLKSDCQER